MKRADVRPYICKGFINIPYTELIQMIDKMSVDSVCSSLAISIKQGLLEYPYKRYFMRDPLDLIENKSRARILHREYISDLLEYQKSENRLYNGEELSLIFTVEDYYTLDMITEYFTQYARVKSTLKKNSSPFKLWKKSANFVAKRTIERCLRKQVDLNTEALSGGIFDTKIKQCSNFKVSVIMTICNYFESTVFFDPFAGWGDRAIGAMLSDTVSTYIGTDPNTLLKDGYEEIVEFFDTYRSNKRITFNDLPIEDLNMDDIFTAETEYPDLIFSSPPFYDYEIYSNESTQSINRYPDRDSWCNDWFIPITLKIFPYLKVGGRLIYHFNDVGINILDKLIDSMPDDSLFEGQIPIMRENRRPVFMYIWKKV